VCGDDAVHNKKKRMCVDCEATKAAKPKGKGKGKGKGKRKAVSDSESESESESEDEYDLSKDEQLMVSVDKRIEKVKVHSNIEYCVDTFLPDGTNLGPSWFSGKVMEVKGDGIVKFVEDEDGSVHHSFDLNENIWKFLKN
jgi:hypothetical protein